MAEVVGAIPVNAVLQGWTITQTPGWFASLGPGVTQVHIAMKMRLIDVEKPHLFPTDLGKERLELLDKCSPFLWVGFAEYLLTLLPTQTILFQDLAHGTAADFLPEGVSDPAAQLFHGPVVAR